MPLVSMQVAGPARVTQPSLPQVLALGLPEAPVGVGRQPQKHPFPGCGAYPAGQPEASVEGRETPH